MKAYKLLLTAVLSVLVFQAAHAGSDLTLQWAPLVNQDKANLQVFKLGAPKVGPLGLAYLPETMNRYCNFVAASVRHSLRVEGDTPIYEGNATSVGPTKDATAKYSYVKGEHHFDSVVGVQVVNELRCAPKKLPGAAI